MKKFLISIANQATHRFWRLAIGLLLAFSLAACAGSPAVKPEKTATSHPTPSPTLELAANTPEQLALTGKSTPESQAAPEKTGKEATRQPECSPAPLSESIITVGWMDAVQRSRLTPLDPVSELPVCGYQSLIFKESFSHAFSPSGRQLAVVDNSPADFKDGFLHLIDLQTWEEVTTTVKIDDPVWQMSYDPSESQLVVASVNEKGPPHHLTLIDLAQEKIIAQREITFTPRILSFTSDGAAVIAFGGFEGLGDKTVPFAHAALLDASDLSIQWEQSLQDIRIGGAQQEEIDSTPIFEYWDPGKALSPDRTVLYVVHADTDRLTTINFTERSVNTVDILPKGSWLERLIYRTAGVAHAKAGNGTYKQASLSPDGKLLYITGQTDKTEKDSDGQLQFAQIPLGLQVIDVSTGTEVARLASPASSAVLSPDGAILYLQGWDKDKAWTEVIDTDGLKLLHRLHNQSVIPARLLSGQPVLLATQQSGDAIRMALLGPDSVDPAEVWKTRRTVNFGYPLSP